MHEAARVPSRRQVGLLEAAHDYALAHGLAEVSLRSLAAAIGSSPRVSLRRQEGLIRALLAWARAVGLAVLGALRADQPATDLTGAAERTETLAVLRGALLDLLATGDRERTTAAVWQHLAVP